MATKSKQTISFDMAIDKYYKLKHDYDSSIQSNLTKIRTNQALNSAEKQEKFRALKTKCISCGKSGGTIFKSNNGVLIALCGNVDIPCKLDIQLQRAKWENIGQDVLNSSIIVNKKKIDIISTKLKFLFGFTNEQNTISVFNKFKTDLIKEVKIYQQLSEHYKNVIENGANKDAIKRLNDGLFILIHKFKDFIKEFDETGEMRYLKDAGELYVNEIMKTVEKLQNLKYPLEYIYTDDDNTNHLVQEHYLPSQLQTIVPGTKNKIISFTL